MSAVTRWPAKPLIQNATDLWKPGACTGLCGGASDAFRSGALRLRDYRCYGDATPASKPGIGPGLSWR